MAYNFQTRNNKIKLLTEYESVTQKVLISLESILQNAKQLQHACLLWHTRCPSGISISLQVFSSICGVTVSIAAPFWCRTLLVS
jgi:hypothetical protein